MYKKKGKHMENQKQNFKTEKKRKQNKWTKKGTSKREKQREKNGFVHLKPKKTCKIKAKKQQVEKAK